MTDKNFAQRSLNDMHPPSRPIASKNLFGSLFTPHVYVCQCRVTEFWFSNAEDVDGDWLLGYGRRSWKQGQVAVAQYLCSSFVDSVDKQKVIRTALTHESDINIQYKPRLAIHYERGDGYKRRCAPLWLMQPITIRDQTLVLDFFLRTNLSGRNRSAADPSRIDSH